MKLLRGAVVDRADIGLAGALFSVLVAACAAMTINPWAGAAVGLAPIVLALMIQWSWFRLAVAVGGGMFVLGSSSDVGPAKVIYTAALLLCAAISFYRLHVSPPPYIRHFRGLPTLGIVLVFCMILGTASAGSSDSMTVIRQGLFYFMIPLAPIIGLDAGRDVKPAVVMRWIAVIGTVAAIGFATDWLNRRGVSSLSVSKFMLASLVLPGFAFSLATVRIAFAKGLALIFWAMPFIIIPVAMLVTGTRTNLIIFFALLGVMGSIKNFKVPATRVVLLAAAGIGAATVLIPVIGDYVISRPGFLESRTQALVTVFTGDAQSDGSFSGRSEQYDFAWKLVLENPVFGLGPGYTSPTSLDTPLATVVRLGFAGTIVTLWFLLTMLIGVARSRKEMGGSFLHTAVGGSAVVFLANIPFGTPFEDRGFGYLVMLICLGVASAHTFPDTPPQSPWWLRKTTRAVSRAQLPSWANGRGGAGYGALPASIRR